VIVGVLVGVVMMMMMDRAVAVGHQAAALIARHGLAGLLGRGLEERGLEEKGLDERKALARGLGERPWREGGLGVVDAIGK